jgi:hypothetical protein
MHASLAITNKINQMKPAIIYVSFIAKKNKIFE